MVGYSVVEAAIVDRILTVFSSELDASRCKAGDVDAVISAMLESNIEYGCYVDFAGGMEDTRKPFATPVWVWTTLGVFLIRYGDDVETKLRSVIDKVSTLFQAGNHKLQGNVPMVKIAKLGDPDVMEIADTPFYWLPFIIESIDRHVLD